MPTERSGARQNAGCNGQRLIGVYTSVPAELPPALRGLDIVIAGGNFYAAVQLATSCSSVTYVTARTTRLTGVRPPNVRIRYGSEVVCADGVEHVETVIVRKLGSGAITACSAAALFLITTDHENALSAHDPFTMTIGATI